MNFYLLLEVFADDQEVEPDLFLAILQNPVLNLGFGQFDPIFLVFVLPDHYRTCLQTIQLIQMVFKRHVTHKVVNITLLFRLLILFENERFWPAETIVDLSYRLRIAQGQSFVFARQKTRELVELFENSFNLDGGIEEYGQDSLSCTSVVNDLSGEEEVFVVHGQGFFGVVVFGPFEEEDESEDLGLDFGNKLIILHTVDFLDLSGGDAQFVDEFGEDAGIRLDGAPLVEHF